MKKRKPLFFKLKLLHYSIPKNLKQVLAIFWANATHGKFGDTVNLQESVLQKLNHVLNYISHSLTSDSLHAFSDSTEHNVNLKENRVSIFMIPQVQKEPLISEEMAGHESMGQWFIKAVQLLT